MNRATYTQPLSADHEVDVLIDFSVLILRFGAVAGVVGVNVGAITAI